MAVRPWGFKSLRPHKVMSKSIITREEDKTIKITVTLSWPEIKPIWEQVVEKMASAAKLPGFRAGKAPKKLIEEKLNKDTIREEVLREALPKAYFDAIQEHQIKPIVDPRIHVPGEKEGNSLEEGKDWIFEAVTAEAPEVNLDGYKEAVKDVTAKGKIVVPGKEKSEVKFEDIVKAVLTSVKVIIPRVLIERETDRVLAQSLDEIKKLGLSLDQYLASTGRNPEQFRKEYEEKAANDLRLEFALQKIAETENIKVEDSEIQKTLDTAKDPEEKKAMEANKYLIASIIRQQKTLDFLRNL